MGLALTVFGRTLAVVNCKNRLAPESKSGVASRRFHAGEGMVTVGSRLWSGFGRRLFITEPRKPQVYFRGEQLSFESRDRRRRSRRCSGGSDISTSGLILTKSLANVRSCTDAFGYQALSFTIVEHSPFNLRNLPTTGLSAGRLWPNGG